MDFAESGHSSSRCPGNMNVLNVRLIHPLAPPSVRNRFRATPATPLQSMSPSAGGAALPAVPGARPLLQRGIRPAGCRTALLAIRALRIAHQSRLARGAGLAPKPPPRRAFRSRGLRALALPRYRSRSRAAPDTHLLQVLGWPLSVQQSTARA